MFFTKMSAYGNDYLYVDCFAERVLQPGSEARKLCDRHDGVGADGLVLLCPSESADFRMRIFDPDGTEAEMCGNALRSASYLFRRTHGREAPVLSVETLAGVKQVFFPAGCDGKGIRTEFGKPEVGFVKKKLTAAGETVEATSLSFGNPHLVVFGSEPTDERFRKLGPALEHHALFPERTNVEFVSIVGEDRFVLRTWERGCGETLCCATGSAASLAAARLQGKLGKRAIAVQKGGELPVEAGEDGTYSVTGDTRIVFTGNTF